MKSHIFRSDTRRIQVPTSPRVGLDRSAVPENRSRAVKM